MIALVQRVSHASVSVENVKLSEIGKGFLVLLGVFDGDSEKDIELLAKKTANLRVFTDENDRMNLSPLQLIKNGEDCRMLVVSQFTLCANCKGQNRPSFMAAAEPALADAYYQKYVTLLREQYGIVTETGKFGADMKVELLNDGPVTIILDTKEL